MQASIQKDLMEARTKGSLSKDNASQVMMKMMLLKQIERGGGMMGGGGMGGGGGIGGGPGMGSMGGGDDLEDDGRDEL